MPPKKSAVEETDKKTKHTRYMTAAERREMFLKSEKEAKPDFHVLKSDDREELVPYGMITLDNVLGLGGIGFRGRVSQIHGNEGAGKSTLTYAIAANFQKYTGEPLADYDFERTGTVPFIARVGVDPDLCHFEQPDNVQKCVQDTVNQLLRGVRFFIYDSIPRMKTKVALQDIKNGNAFKEFGGNHARTMGNFFDILLPYFAEYNAHMLMVNQTRDRIEEGTDAANAQKYPTFTNLPYSLPGGKICRFTPSVMTELKLIKGLKPNEGKEGEDPWLIEPATDATQGKIVVNQVRARALKNKVTGNGYREGFVFVRPGIGIDENMAIRYYARQYDLIRWLGKKWVVGTDDKTIATFENKTEAIEKLVIKPDITIMDSLKKLTAQLIDSDEATKFTTNVSASLATLVEGVEDVPEADDVEVSAKSKAFELED